jgi:hypothetical protein
MWDIDLANGGLFDAYVLDNWGEWGGDKNNVMIAADGFGDPSGDPTDPGPLYTFGSEADTYMVPVDIITQLLIQVAGFAAADVTDSTGGRAGVYLRYTGPLADPSSFVEALRHLCSEGMVFLFPKRAGGWEIKDVRKADSSDWTVTDGDLVSERWIKDRSLMAQKVLGEAWFYHQNEDGTYTVGEAASLQTQAKARHGVQRTMDLGRSWFYNATAWTTWADTAMGKMWVNPQVFWECRVSARFATIELMDVVTNSTSTIPSGVGTRYRPISIQPEEDGTVSMLCMSETLFPADGTSTPGTRPALLPLPVAQDGDDAGVVVAAGGPTAVENAGVVLGLSEGEGSWVSGVTHRLVVEAERDGASALTFRLQDLQNAQTLGTTPAFGAVRGFQAVALSNLPSANARCELQSTSTGGLSKYYGYHWEAIEVTPDWSEWTSPATAANWWRSSGEALSTDPAVQDFANPPYFLMLMQAVTRQLYITWYTTVSSPTGYTLELWARHPPSGVQTQVSTTATITASGYHSALIPFKWEGWEFWPRYTLTGGAATVYGWTIAAYHVTDGQYYLTLWAPNSITHAPETLVPAAVWTQIADYEYIRQGGTAIETGGDIYHRTMTLVNIPAGATIQTQLWDDTNSAEIMSGSRTNDAATAKLRVVVAEHTASNLPGADARIVMRYKLSGASNATYHAMTWDVYKHHG